MTKFDPQITREEFLQRVKNAIWASEAFHFTNLNALEYINSGLLGYRTNADGTLLKNEDSPIPIKISESTYKRYKRAYSELPEIYQELGRLATTGFVQLLMKYVAELQALHKMSVENVMSAKIGSERQSVIDSLVTKVMPAESAFIEMVKKIVDSRMIKMPIENEQQK